MNAVLAGFHLMIKFNPAMHTHPESGRDINLMPSNKNYPRHQRFRGGSGTSHTEEIDRPAMAFRERVDERHKQFFKSPFYETSWLLRRVLPDAGMGRPEELAKAEKVSFQLSKMTRSNKAITVAF